MTEVSKDLWDTELADIPMPAGGTYADFRQIAVEKQRYESRLDQAKFIQQLQRIAAQRPEIKPQITAYIDDAIEAGL